MNIPTSVSTASTRVAPKSTQISTHGHLCKISKYNRLKFRYIEDSNTAEKLNTCAKTLLCVDTHMIFSPAGKYLVKVEDMYGYADSSDTFHLAFDDKGFIVQLPHGMKAPTPDISACIGLDCILMLKMTKYQFKSKLAANLGELVTGINLTLVSIRVGTV